MHCGEVEVNKIKVFYTRINVAYKSFACTLSDQYNDHVKQKRQRFYLCVIHLVLILNTYVRRVYWVVSSAQCAGDMVVGKMDMELRVQKSRQTRSQVSHNVYF